MAIQKTQKRQTRNDKHEPHFEERYRVVFYLSRALAGLLLLAVTWDPIPGLVSDIMKSDMAVGLIVIALVALVTLLSVDLITRGQHGWRELVSKYIYLIMGVVLLFGVFFIILQTRTADSGLRVAIGTDALSERDAFYFSAVTYFTVGYGDIVPYGYAKLLSVVEAGIGTVINLIILAMAVTRVRDHEGH